MERKIRYKYAEYIAASIRYMLKETGKNLPEDTIIVAKSYCDLANLDNILGIDIYVMDMPSDRDFFIAFKAENVDSYTMQKAFIAFTEMYDIEDDD